jgi:hypothetical protein
MILGMTKEMSSWILVGLSILYGVTIAVLGALDVTVTPFAIIGAVVLGALWIIRGMVLRRG